MAALSGEWRCLSQPGSESDLLPPAKAEKVVLINMIFDPIYNMILDICHFPHESSRTGEAFGPIKAF